MADVDVSFGATGLATLATGFDSFLNLLTRFKGVAQELITQHDVHAQLTSRLAGSITEASEATNGLVDDLELMRSRNAIAFAGLRLTETEFRNVSVAAVEYGRSTGKNATEAMADLTRALISGNERGLRPLGIQFEEGMSRADRFSSAVQQLGTRFGGVTAEAETTSEAMFQVAEAWEDIEIAFVQGVTGAVNATEGLGQLAEAMKELIPIANALGIALAEGLKFLMNPAGLSAQIRDVRRRREAALEGPAEMVFFPEEVGIPPELQTAEAVATAERRLAARARRGAGGGGGAGRREARPSDMAFTPEEAERGQFGLPSTEGFDAVIEQAGEAQGLYLGQYESFEDALTALAAEEAEERVRIAQEEFAEIGELIDLFMRASTDAITAVITGEKTGIEALAGLAAAFAQHLSVLAGKEALKEFALAAGDFAAAGTASATVGGAVLAPGFIAAAHGHIAAGAAWGLLGIGVGVAGGVLSAASSGGGASAGRGSTAADTSTLPTRDLDRGGAPIELNFFGVLVTREQVQDAVYDLLDTANEERGRVLRQVRQAA